MIRIVFFAPYPAIFSDIRKVFQARPDREELEYEVCQDIPDNPPPGDPGDPPEEIPEEEVPLATLPQTGLLQWPIPVMAAAGLLLVAVGLLSERKRRAGN